MRSLIGVACVVAASAACTGEPPPEPPATLSSIHDDIFHVSCSASVCHGGPGPVYGMNLDVDPFTSLVNVDSQDNQGEKRVVPGKPEESVLYLVLLGPHGASKQMPLGGDPLPAEDIDRIKRWIADGAKND